MLRKGHHLSGQVRWDADVLLGGQDVEAVLLQREAVVLHRRPDGPEEARVVVLAHPPKVDDLVCGNSFKPDVFQR